MIAALDRPEIDGLKHLVAPDLGQATMLQPFLQLRHVGVSNGAHLLEFVRCSAVRSRQRRNEHRLAEHFVKRETISIGRNAPKNGEDIGDVGDKTPALRP